VTLSISLRHRMGDFRLAVDLTAPGGVTALFGRSGSGKTSVINAVAGLLRPDQARIRLGDAVLTDTAHGVFVPPHRRRMGYVFQDARLFPHLNVRSNLRYGLWCAGRRANRSLWDPVIDMLGLGPLLARRPGALSGGEKQRVAIGRALLSAPHLLLLDEPLAALDDARKAEILPYLERLRDQTDVPMLYVSHARAEITRLATTVALLDAGSVSRVGPVATILPEAPGAQITGTIAAHHPDGLSEVTVSAARLFVPTLPDAVGACIRLNYAPRDVMIATTPPGALSTLNILPATITTLQTDGTGVTVTLASGTDTLTAQVPARVAAGLTQGLPCHAILPTLLPDTGDPGLP